MLLKPCLIAILLVFNTLIVDAGGNCCTKMKENENLQVKKVKEINENTFEIFEDQDVRFFEKGGKLALDINYSEFPESTDPPSDASQIQLLPQNQRSLVLDGLEIVRAALKREDYSNVYYAFFVEYAKPKPQLLSTFYRVCICTTH